MSNEVELREKLLKALHKDMTLMLGLAGVEEGHSRPMTAQFDDQLPDGPIWFFAARDTDFVREMGDTHRGLAHFASKGHDLFASIHGELSVSNDRAQID